MKKLLLCFFAICLIAACVLILPTNVQAANVRAGGTCGSNLYWALDYAGTLTISGTGTMYYYYEYTPWYICSDMIKRVVIEPGTTNISASAFAYCENLTDVSIPDSVTSIGEDAFYNCTSLTNITLPDSVSEIGYCAFGYCTGLESITMPANATLEVSHGFYMCVNLTGVYISDLTSWCNISFVGNTSNPLRYAKNLYLNGELVTDLVIPSSVSTIGMHAFDGCQSITSVTIPEGVTKIKSDAFHNCDRLTDVYISDLTSWCNIFFVGDSSNPLRYAKNLYLNGELVTDLVIPSSISTINKYAFYGFQGITGVTIPEGITRIDRYAFENCSNLQRVTIPGSVKSIRSRAFANCENLEEIVFLGDAPQIQAYEIFSEYDDLEEELVIYEVILGAFWGTTVTAYYPSGNDTWTESVRQDYDGTITWVSYGPPVPGDFNGDTVADNQDVEYLLWYTLFPEDYPISGNVDFTGDGIVDNEDVAYLLWYTLFPEDYPI